MVHITASCLGRTRHADKYWGRQQIFRLTAHYFGRKRNCYTIAVRYAQKALQHAMRGRRDKKKVMRQLWHIRLNAACIEHGIGAKDFFEALSRLNIHLDRNMLVTLAVYEPRTFESLVEISKRYWTQQGITVEGLKQPVGILTRGML
ncbi:uncharacterized protein LOC106165654 [Lingula anatina]|uniref:Uncharacterized protein LOC106165654 n=1 Tax=Lingula anatina TaxID=7574 RepID=A0A1S3IMH7_LINAN|nr:uncharacterized protein LOC106165654 [Lingula anatina]|eukprot:XP_013399407.1 uncharacterized protein LOC106165654 [Lingula anatina]